ncbi:hypothetical protein SAMN02990966_01799 [Rhodospirillales bacterium URHD0017]|nr:hypothetical protein SAMN02990966_01799 [Rhodospirillales bacterium URHD0017]
MRAPVGTIVLLSLAAVLYAAMMSCLADAPGGDAFGRGLALAYAAILGAVLWFVLAAALVIAAVKGRMPVWAAIGLVALLPLSCIAVWMAGDAVGRGDSSALLVPALLPPLFALYALWARLPALHARLRAGVVSAVIGAAIVLLTAAPFVAMTRAALPDPARDARLAEAAKVQEQEQAKERQAARDRDEAEFAKLGPDSPLESYLVYLHAETYGARARAGIGRLTNRQADAIAMLAKGRLLDLWDLRELDLSPTADLCQAYGAALAGAAGKVSKTQSNYLGVALDLEGQLPNIRWLIANRCDLGQPLGLLAGNVRAVADSSRMTGFADTIDALARVK